MALETARVDGPPVAEGEPWAAFAGAGRVGRYVVLEEVGRGGMGRVLRAYDPKLQREVALKQLRGDVLGEEGSARLVREARAMARLSHPNVVAVYDVDARDDGRLVIVMEYVAGTTLRAWMRDEPRNWRALVDRFTAAGRGLAAAHEAGLLHRDFKPSNVLVRGDDVVKVTDFGLARGAGEVGAANGHSPEEEVGTDQATGSLTRAGVVMGTPRYMAPEQERGEALTAAADQYAFCVALWEALCGEPPFRGRKVAQQKRAGPPAWPNAAVPRPIADAIVRGLDPQPRGRWPSMSALLEVLGYEPAKRSGRWLMAVGGVAVVGIIGASFQLWAAGRAQRCSGATQELAGVWDGSSRSEARAAMVGVGVPYAEAAWGRTQTVLDRYAAGWTAMHTDACEATTVRGDQSPEVMDLRIACLQRAKVELTAVAGVLAAADAEVVRKAHELVGGLAPLSRCADVEALRADVEPPLPRQAADVDEIRRSVSEAKAETDAGRYAAAQAKLDGANARLAEVDYGPVRTEVALQSAETLERLGQYEASEATLVEAMDSAARWRQWEQLQGAVTQLLFVVGCRQQRREAMRYRELALALSWGDARQEAAARNNLGLALMHALGHYPEAEAEFRSALELKQQTVGPDHPSLARTRGNLASVLQAQGRYEEAEAEQRGALAIRERALGPEHPDVASSLDGLATVLSLRGHYEEAEAEHRRALALRQKTLGVDHPEIAESRSNLAVALFEQGRYAEAETEHRLALALRLKTLGPEHPGVAKSINNLASTLYSLEKYDDALVQFRRALQLRTQALGSEHPDVATGRNNLAHVLLRLGRAEEALPLAQQAWSRRDRDGIPPGRQADTAFVLARALWATSDQPDQRAQARAFAELALDRYTTAGETDSSSAHRVRAWLADKGAGSRSRGR